MESDDLQALLNLPVAQLISRLREVLENPSLTTPPVSGDGGLHPGVDGKSLKPAAVLVPLVLRDDELHVILTRRTDHLRDHAGQISFPGGRAEKHDADITAAALRETEEEVGIAPHHIEVIGDLEVYRTVTGYAVTPIIGLVDPGHDIAPDVFEVAEVFEIPFRLVLNPEHFQRHTRMFLDRERSYYVVPYRHYYIWGATAAMLRNLCERVRPMWDTQLTPSS
jgi:8-oxo-dGTP pyrophosphatase MutT (NUDIX family)